MKSLLKFITCGSVDDGKSTLIGHMLYDAKLIFADQKRALELDSRLGSGGEGELDYSLLLDGLMAEREQGITIDVAYRYFTTEKRSFIVADTPGHEEYTRNMAVGASFAQLAVILIDATQGVLLQTRRHTRICSLMGIRHFVFAVNKMDLIHYDRKKFEEIRRQIRQLMAEFEYDSLEMIPVSATQGDHVTSRSSRMPWYKGEPLLTYLEEVDASGHGEEQDFMMPVQRVCRPNYEFRGFEGEVEAGNINVGDKVTILPSKEQAAVKSILSRGREVDRADKGQPVTITLNREVDVSRGCVLTRDQDIRIANLFTATLLWMDDEKLVRGKSYYLKLGTKMVPATVLDVKYKIDVNSGNRVPAEEIYKNEIVCCDISTVEKIVLKPFAQSRVLGGLILIDRVTNQTCACGVVEHILRRAENVVWQNLDVTRLIRSAQLGQKPMTIWFTGLSGSGKSTVANELEKRLAAMGRHTMLLDGDNVRMGLNRNLGFKEQDRVENIRRVAEVARLMNDAGLIVLTAFITPYRQMREMVRDIIGEGYCEIYVSTSLEECERRDVKGLYQKARKGEIPNFTGVSEPYEIPEAPDLVIDTEHEDMDGILEKLLENINRVQAAEEE